MLDALVLADRPVEDDALARVLGGAAQRVLADRDRLRGDQQPLRVQAVQDVREALAFLADAIGVGMNRPSMKIEFESTALRPIFGCGAPRSCCGRGRCRRS
jgi:hypothetical protein